MECWRMNFMADAQRINVEVNESLVARVRALEAALRQILAPSCQCQHCQVARAALGEEPDPPVMERCWDCRRELQAGEARYVVPGVSFADRKWRCQGCASAVAGE